MKVTRGGRSSNLITGGPGDDLWVQIPTQGVQIPTQGYNRNWNGICLVPTTHTLNIQYIMLLNVSLMIITLGFLLQQTYQNVLVVDMTFDLSLKMVVE